MNLFPWFWRNIAADLRKMGMGILRCTDVLSEAMEEEEKREWSVTIAERRDILPPIARQKVEERREKVRAVERERKGLIGRTTSRKNSSHTNTPPNPISPLYFRLDDPWTLGRWSGRWTR
jgi:hypothetical protein